MKTTKQLFALLMLFFLTKTAVAQSGFNGYVLYTKQNQNTAYLIDKNGDIAHTWSFVRPSNYSIGLKDNGNIVRGAVHTSNSLNGPAVGGKIEEIDPSGNIVWEFVYSSSTYCSHHDIDIMPNGNVLMIAWEVKTPAQLTQAGRTNATSNKWPSHILEVQQNGTGGQIVWEWHIWDHMIQDVNPTKDNYGVVADHPELMDINAVSATGGPPGSGDWFHENGIDYNPILDQIVFTSRYASEFFIIDHSTTTAEAASHSGGNSGKGGDFLYRWGKPANYDAPGTQTITAAVHDPNWILPGRPNAGYIQFFNNSGGTSNSSVVDAINPPINGYTYNITQGQAYAPAIRDWRHNCLANSSGQSAHDRMSNGNTFVAVSNQYMYEVDTLGNTVWSYNDGPAKAFRYECDHPGIIALLGPDPCGLATGLEAIQNADGIVLYPNPTTGMVTIEGVSDVDLNILVYDVYGKLVGQAVNQSYVNLSNYAAGMYYVSLQQGNGDIVNKKITLVK